MGITREEMKGAFIVGNGAAITTNNTLKGMNTKPAADATLLRIRIVIQLFENKSLFMLAIIVRTSCLSHHTIVCY